jgi:hypothetical protein
MKWVRGFFSGVFNFLLFIVLVLLGFVISINMTVLNPDFVTAELRKFDVYSMVIEQAKTRLPTQQYISDEAVDELAAELKPWFEEQADKVVHTVWGYLKSEQELEVAISLEPVRTAVKEKVSQTARGSLPSELQGASQTQIDAYLTQIYAGIDNVIPSNFELNQTLLGSAVMTSLAPVKHIVGYIKIAYIILIAAAILLILLVALAHWWQPKPITLAIGITFTLAGIVCTLGPLLNYLIIQLLSQAIGSFDLLFGLQAKLSQLAADLTSPVRTYGIGFLISGVALIVISVLLRSKQVSHGSVQS